MKKTLLFMGAMAALISCGKEAPVNEGLVDASDLVFDFTVNHPAETRAVKADWESGDKVFIFFEDVTTGYVTTEYDGTDWTSTLHGSAALSNSGKKLTAVYLPFGNTLTPTYNDCWTFGEPQYSYYMKAEKVSYTLTSVDDVTTLSATLDMVNPDTYVQFFMADADGYTLALDCVTPTGVSNIATDGLVSEATLSAGAPMQGYAYADGYLFSGKVGIQKTNYYFTGDIDDGQPGYPFYFTLSTTGHTYTLFRYKTEPLAGHSAIKLPAFASNKWNEVGPGHSVLINGKKWSTVCLGANLPWEEGTNYSWENRASGVSQGWHVATKTEWDSLYNGDLTKFETSVHATPGYVVMDNTNGNNIFIPCIDSRHPTYGATCYWADINDDYYDYCYFNIGKDFCFLTNRETGDTNETWPVWPIKD